MQYIALNVACPLCGSAVGLNCRKPSGWMRGEFHKARKQAVEDSFPKHSDGTQDKRYSVGREFDDFGGMRYIARFMGCCFRFLLQLAARYKQVLFS